MADIQTFQDKLHAAIAGLLREEFPRTYTSIIDNASRVAASAAEGIVIRQKRYIERQGVRPLEFMDLPPELRNKIYSMALKHDHLGQTTIQFDESFVLWFDISPGYGHPACQPPITRVSRAVRDETLKLFYTINTFSINLQLAYALLQDYRKPQFVRWLESVGETNAGKVGRLILRCTPNDEWNAGRLRVYMDEMRVMTDLHLIGAVTVVDHDGTMQ